METDFETFIPSVDEMENIPQHVDVIIDQDMQEELSGEMVVVNGRQMPVEMKADFDKARDNLSTLISKGMGALDDMLKLAKDSEHPRVYDSLNNMMNTMATLNKQLVEVVKDKHKIHLDLPPASETSGSVHQQNNAGAGTVNNNTIFVGSTKELQDFFRNTNIAQGAPA